MPGLTTSEACSALFSHLPFSSLSIVSAFWPPMEKKVFFSQLSYQICYLGTFSSILCAFLVFHSNRGLNLSPFQPKNIHSGEKSQYHVKLLKESSMSEICAGVFLSQFCNLIKEGKEVDLGNWFSVKMFDWHYSFFFPYTAVHKSLIQSRVPTAKGVCGNSSLEVLHNPKSCFILVLMYDELYM